MATPDEQRFIDGSGLFFFKSDLTTEKQLEILKWYRDLPQWQQEYVDLLRREAVNEQAFDNASE